MANTHVKIATATGSGNPSTITFSSIPQTYGDLLIIGSSRNTSTNGNLRMQVNGDGTSMYHQHIFEAIGGNATAVSSGPFSNFQWNNSIATSNDQANVYGSCEFYISKYTSSSTKSFSARFNTEASAGNSYIQETANLIVTTSAITSISLYFFSGSFATETSFYLYGIKNS